MNYWKNLLRIILKKNNLFISLLLVFLCSFSTVHAKQHEHRKAVVIIVNYTNLDEFVGMPNLNRIMQAGAVGLMNTRGASKTDNARAYATLGWGSRADVQSEYSSVEKRQNTLYLNYIDEIKSYNLNNPYNVTVGLLGDYFHSQGLTTSLIESKRVQDKNILHGAFIATDSKGIIDSGAIEEDILIYDEGINSDRTDYESLLNIFKQEYEANDFIVIDTGDISRYEHYRESRQLSQQDKGSLLQSIDGFIGKLSNIIDSQNTLLMVISPHYGVEDGKNGRKLCPVVFYGQDIGQGLLISDTTRRDGLIANIDIAPTIISFFGGNPKNVTGQAVKVKAVDEPLKKAFDLYDLTAFNSLNRALVLKSYIAFQIILLIIILIFILSSVKSVMTTATEHNIQNPKLHTYIKIKQFNSRLLNKISKVLRGMVIFLLICPLTLFLMPLIGINDLFAYMILLVLLNGILVLLIYKVSSNQETTIIIISTLTLICILVDLLMNGPLNKTSLFGYDAIIGARYYGLGNEYMGILIASGLMSVVPLARKKLLPAWLAAVLLILILPVIGLTVFGANVGGTIAATMAFGFAILSLFNRKITVRSILGLIATVALVVGVFAVYDVFFAQYKSHLARALIDFKDRGIDVIFSIIRRKLEMNLKLLRWTIWSQVLVVSIAVMGILFLKPRGMLHMLLDKYKSFSTAWYSILVASVVGMLVNDSGVVVAATSNIFLVFSLLYFLLGEEENGI